MGASGAITCPRCALELSAGSEHPEARDCAVALRQRLQAMLSELELGRKTGSYDPVRLEAFERESRKLLAKVQDLERGSRG